MNFSSRQGEVRRTHVNTICHQREIIELLFTARVIVNGRSPYSPSLHFLETPYTEKTFSLLHRFLKMALDKYTTSLLISVSSQILVPLPCLSSRLWK
ncbi:hypothetical protein [Tolypothrix sp. VBCCA 56010]|uniref:hypothetical protein n=1 Tax=Tolypothrix sp. VBCCA 56010 TaxID=3137731 RepID=UPI003D7D8A14